MLQVFVTTGCDACDHARSVAQRVVEELDGVQVDVIDIEAEPERVPPSVFAVPSYLLNGALISLGNPSWEQLSTMLTSGGTA